MLACLEDDRHETKKQNLIEIMIFFSSVTCLLGEVYKLPLKIYGMVMIYRIYSNERRTWSGKVNKPRSGDTKNEISASGLIRLNTVL